MATEVGVSKLRVENGSGNRVAEAGIAEEELEEVSATSVMTTLPMPEADLSILSRGDSASGRWVIAGAGQVLGLFSGEIECGGTLIIGKGAEVTATIRGTEVTIAGLVRGNITAVGRLRITATGRLEGDARVGSLVVQAGGVHHGAIRVHPEGVPDEDEPVAEAVLAPPAEVAPQTRVDRVKKFWGEFF